MICKECGGNIYHQCPLFRMKLGTNSDGSDTYETSGQVLEALAKYIAGRRDEDNTILANRLVDQFLGIGITIRSDV